VISVVETIDLPVPPERVWRFFAEEIEHRYTDWHREHLRWRWLSGNSLEPGAAWFADEWIGHVRIAGRFVVSEAQPGRGFSYVLAFPASLVRAGGSFRFDATDDGGCCRLVQTVQMGFSLPLVGRAIDLAIAAVLPLGELHRHIREEQANLPALLGA